MSFKYNHFLLSSCLPVVAFAVFTTASAQAGFEWSPPKAQEEKVEMIMTPQVTPEPIDVIDATEIEISSIMDNEGEQVQESAPSLEINLFPLDNLENSMMADEAEAIILSENSNHSIADSNEHHGNMSHTEEMMHEGNNTFGITEGFGSEMPLALALRQIVPAEYAFSFGDHVNAGASISWTGGKPWNETLQDSLAPLNIVFEIQHKKVLLTHGNIVKSTHVDMPAIHMEEDNTKKKVLKPLTPWVL